MVQPIRLLQCQVIRSHTDLKFGERERKVCSLVSLNAFVQLVNNNMLNASLNKNIYIPPSREDNMLIYQLYRCHGNIPQLLAEPRVI